MSPTGTASKPFGTVLTAMVTPFTAELEVDYDTAQQLAADLVALGNDGLIINGTTGEAPTTWPKEKAKLVRAVVEAVGDRAFVVAGVGNNDTRDTVEHAEEAARAGAHGLLVVCPYYSKPTQAGVLAHYRAVADATDLGVVTYDIPGRTGIQIAHETFLALAAHPRIVANKDAKGDVWAAQRVIQATGLPWYSGDDPLNLPLLAVGAVGCISVTGHIVADRIKAMIAAYNAGDVALARELNMALVPVTHGIMGRLGGAIMVKAALDLLGRVGGGAMRLPMVPADEATRVQLRADLIAGGVSF
ncbi:MAG: 4-hydroxy-tetrahydrodipicolinate synthase [Candidatus Nanopelagicales bacterium]